jgi:GntR family transcriptional regulator/MocR family aminotransferase
MISASAWPRARRGCRPGRYRATTARAATQQGLLLGYACVPEAEIGPAFRKLAEVIEPALEHLARTQEPPKPIAARINAEAWSGA